MRIPGAFRSLPRPSSLPEAKASSVRSSSLSRTFRMNHLRHLRLKYFTRLPLKLQSLIRNSKKLEFLIIQTIISLTSFTSLSLSVLSMISKCAFTAATHCIKQKTDDKYKESKRLALWHEPRAASVKVRLQKGGVPATPSGTATLLRLSPSHRFCLRPLLAVTDFRHPQLPWLDGRCVQGPGTYSPRHG